MPQHRWPQEPTRSKYSRVDPTIHTPSSFLRNRGCGRRSSSRRRCVATFEACVQAGDGIGHSGQDASKAREPASIYPTGGTVEVLPSPRAAPPKCASATRNPSKLLSRRAVSALRFVCHQCANSAKWGETGRCSAEDQPHISVNGEYTYGTDTNSAELRKTPQIMNGVQGVAADREVTISLARSRTLLGG